MTNIDLAQKCVIYACNDLKIKPVPTHFVSPATFGNETITAMYLPNLDVILFNEDWINSALPEEVALTAFHEARHLYQKCMIDLAETKGDITVDLYISRWKVEFDNYTQPVAKDEEGNRQYLVLSIEEDAVAYAARTLVSIIG